MGQGLISILTGVAIGLAGAIALTRLLAGLLFGVSQTRPGGLCCYRVVVDCRRVGGVRHSCQEGYQSRSLGGAATRLR